MEIVESFLYFVSLFRILSKLMQENTFRHLNIEESPFSLINYLEFEIQLLSKLCCFGQNIYLPALRRQALAGHRSHSLENLNEYYFQGKKKIHE